MQINVSCEVESKANEVLSALKHQMLLGLEAIGETAEGYAVENCPVDTSRLRNSISYRLQGDSVYIGTNVEYAPYVELNEKARHDPPEFGGGKAHFLRDAAADHGEEYKAIMQMFLES